MTTATRYYRRHDSEGDALQAGSAAELTAAGNRAHALTVLVVSGRNVDFARYVSTVGAARDAYRAGAACAQRTADAAIEVHYMVS